MAKIGSARRLFKKEGREAAPPGEGCRPGDLRLGPPVRARWRRCPSDVRCAVLGAKLGGDDCVVIRVEATEASPMWFGLTGSFIMAGHLPYYASSDFKALS